MNPDGHTFSHVFGLLNRPTKHPGYLAEYDCLPAADSLVVRKLTQPPKTHLRRLRRSVAFVLLLCMPDLYSLPGTRKSDFL